MRQGMKEKIIRICDAKIAAKGSDVGTILIPNINKLE